MHSIEKESVEFEPFNSQSNCSPYDNEIVREFPIELKLEADYELFFITVEGKEIAMHEQDESTFKDDSFQLTGDTLCFKYEGIEISNEEKEKLKITIGLNDSVYVYEYKLDFSVDGITYETRMPLSLWGILNAQDESLITNK